ncbi:hypothetical protein [Conexibacter woesei]|uniref:hypothetical protein n=1 Tax=Conexibacter woesei TaxID=191495 RepID=UPI0012DF5EC5|nr:hypothetical protein [Conexibacter woesei]
MSNPYDFKRIQDTLRTSAIVSPEILESFRRSAIVSPEILESFRRSAIVSPEILESFRRSVTLSPDVVRTLKEATRLPTANWDDFFVRVTLPRDEWRAALGAMADSIASVPVAVPEAWAAAVDDTLTELEDAEIDETADEASPWYARLTVRQRVLLVVHFQAVLEALAQFIEDNGGGSIPPAVRSGVVLIATTLAAILATMDGRDDLNE